MEDDGGGSLMSLDGVAPSWVVSVSAYVIFPCTIKSRKRFLLAPPHLGSPGKRAVKRLCVHVCVWQKDVLYCMPSCVKLLRMCKRLGHPVVMMIVVWSLWCLFRTRSRTWCFVTGRRTSEADCCRYWCRSRITEWYVAMNVLMVNSLANGNVIVIRVIYVWYRDSIGNTIWASCRQQEHKGSQIFLQ